MIGWLTDAFVPHIAITAVTTNDRHRRRRAMVNGKAAAQKEEGEEEEEDWDVEKEEEEEDYSEEEYPEEEEEGEDDEGSKTRAGPSSFLRVRAVGRPVAPHTATCMHACVHRQGLVWRLVVAAGLLLPTPPRACMHACMRAQTGPGRHHPLTPRLLLLLL